MTGSVIIYGNGAKEWCDANSQRHREDGPAIIRGNGTREWWRDGGKHRVGAPAVISPDGSVCWYRHDDRHREGGPATERPDGTKGWFKYGKIHRDNGPAVIKPDGTRHWIRNGSEWPEGESLFPGDTEKDSVPGYDPAMEAARPDAGGNRPEEKMTTADCALLVGTDNGNFNVVLHADGSRIWRNLQEKHRENGPAVIQADGTKEWHLHGRLHREGGPAIEHADGAREWFRNGFRHREDGPAIEQADGRKYWYLKGEVWPEGEKKYYAERGEEAAKAMKEACAKGPVTAVPRAVFRVRGPKA